MTAVWYALSNHRRGRILAHNLEQGDSNDGEMKSFFFLCQTRKLRLTCSCRFTVIAGTSGQIKKRLDNMRRQPAVNNQRPTYGPIGLD